VGKVFNLCDTPEKKKAATLELKKIIQASNNNGSSMWTRDWSRMDPEMIVDDLDVSSVPPAAVRPAEVPPPVRAPGAWDAPVSAPRDPRQAHILEPPPSAQVPSWQQQQQQQQQQHVLHQQHMQRLQHQSQQHRQHQQQQQQQHESSPRSQRGEMQHPGAAQGRDAQKKRKRERKGAAKGEDEFLLRQESQRGQRLRRFQSLQEGQGGRQSESRPSWESERQEALYQPNADVLIVGTCQGLEKSYLRLTAAPDPATVRPQSVLEKALPRLVAKVAEDGDYAYWWDQIKAVRQDCTVQGLANAFTCGVYEANIRVSVQHGDASELAALLTKLKELYERGADVKECPEGRDAGAVRSEFTAMRLLYWSLRKDSEEVLSALHHLVEEDQEGGAPQADAESPMAYANRVRQALVVGNYSAVFRLADPHATSWALGAQTLQIFFPDLRYEALRAMVNAMRPSVPVVFLSVALHFPDTEHCAAWLQCCGCALHGDPGLEEHVDAKASSDTLAKPTADQLDKLMGEDPSAAPELTLDDFLATTLAE